jgi:hypothetical protein
VLLFDDYERASMKGKSGNLATPLAFAMVKNPGNARLAAAALNPLIKPEDMVIASYNIWHLIDARTTNIPISLAYKGIESDFFLYTISHSRFNYDPSIDNANYAILDFLTDQMAQAPQESFHYPVRLEIERIKKEWQIIATFGEFTIYKNPKIK